MLSLVKCLTCSKEFEARRADLKRGHAKYCSRKCFGQRPNKVKIVHEPNVTCAYCEKAFYKSKSKQAKSKHGIFFCCREHKDLGQRIGGIEAIQPSHYGTGNGHTSYRIIAFKEYEKRCTRCSFDKVPEVLEVHHIDRNRFNSAVENLEVLCPTCHRIEHFQAKDGRWSSK